MPDTDGRTIFNRARSALMMFSDVLLEKYIQEIEPSTFDMLYLYALAHALLPMDTAIKFTHVPHLVGLALGYNSVRTA